MLDANIINDLALVVPQRGHEHMVPEHRPVRFVLSKIHRRVRALCTREPIAESGTVVQVYCNSANIENAKKYDLLFGGFWGKSCA